MNSTQTRSASTSRPGMTTKSDRYRDHIGQAVSVDNAGTGILRYFELDGDVKICGVELDEAMGDCNGEDLDGNSFFKCADNHGIYVSMKEVTLLDANGNPIVKKTKAKPKKKFDSPPSLRKKIVRKEPTSRRGDTSKSTKSKNPPSKNTAAGVAHQKKLNQGAKKKVDHLAKSNTGINASVSEYANADRKIIKRNPAPAPVPVEATADDEELPDLDDDGANSSKGVDDVAKIARQVPTDWIEAAKEKQREAEEAVAREKEAADLAAQERRLQEANAKAAAEEEEFHRKAMEAARLRDEKRQEAARLREEQAAARAAIREEKDRLALEQMNEYNKANDEEVRRREEADVKLLEQREAQKARIAAMMARVKAKT